MLCLAPCRDLLQTLTEEELHTLERSLCVSQDAEFPTRADAQAAPALAPALPPPLPPEEELLPAKAKPPEAELACSMQYDDQELEQLNRMVHRAGAEMSSLLSPPSACQSPARGPGPEGSPGGQASPGGGQPQPSSDEEEGRVFFMDDVEAATEAPGSPPRRTASAGDGDDPGGRARGGAEWDPSNNNNNVQDDKMPPAGPTSCSCLDGWEGTVDAAEMAEAIAQRTGGMKLSATVIFNPKPPTSLDATAPDAPGSGGSASEPAAEGPEGPERGPHQLGSAATNCLLNSCVCCGGCGGGREDAAESLPDSCRPRGVIRACHVGAAKASAKGGPARPEEARPALELPVGAPAPLPSDSGPNGPEPEAPTSSKCLDTSGPPADSVDGLHGGGAGPRQQEPEGGRQDDGPRPEAGEDSRRPSGPR